MDRWITDSTPSAKYPIYTRANAGEVMPDPGSPLTITLAMQAQGELGWRDAYVRVGTFDYDEFEAGRANCIACFGSYLYLNMSTTRLYGVRTPGLTPEMVDFQYFGEMPGIPPYPDEARPDDVSPVHEERMGAYLQWVFTREDLPELRQWADTVDQMVATRPDLRHMSNEALVARARSFSPWFRKLFDIHISTSGASGIGIATVAGICQEIGRPELALSLVAGVGDVESAAPSSVMWDLSRIAAGSPALTSAFDAGVDGLPERLASSADAEVARFAAAFESFVDRFGARGPNEWELRSDTWGTRPEIALAAIDRMRLAGDDASPVGHHATLSRDREAATAAVEAALAGNDEVLAQFQAALRAALLFAAGRERTKTNNIKVVHEMRLALRELGRRQVEAGTLDDEKGIFMLLDSELEQFLIRPDTMTETVRQREAEYRSFFELEPPFIIHKSPPPLSAWKKRGESSVEQAVSGDVLTGIPGCPGSATGRARVVLDPSDPSALQPGDVLVAPLTDPAWTPLFVPAAAVIVDVGAQITHAVIVSRELGIPCVVSVIDATKKIPDGAMVTVDGTAGTVLVH
jgi:pyruvate,water dikinase